MAENWLAILMNIRRWAPRLLRFWGIDRAIAYTIVGRGWSVLAGPLTLLFIARFLSPAEQGFYYTFGSLLGLQIFFELGLSYVILQFASHEKAKLEWTDQGLLEGDATAKARLAALLRRAIVWYGIIALLALAIVLPAGLYFFGQHQPVGVQVRWQIPWVWVVLVSAIGLFVTPFFAVLEGCGLVAEVAFMRVCQSILGSLLLWVALSQQWQLFAAPVLNTVGLLWALGWLGLRKRAFLSDLVAVPHDPVAIGWRAEVWPFQWKIALSWLSGYFIYQLFNPVLFAFHGAVAAGQMGMSINVVTAIWAVGLAWVNTKAAPFGNLIAKRDFKGLDRMFFPCLWQSLAAVACGGMMFWAAAFYARYLHHPLGQRLLDPLPLGLLVATMVVNQIVVAEATYLRAHKQEPFLGVSMLAACLVGLSTYFLGRPFGATGMMVGYFTVIVVVGLGFGTWVFVRKRRLWHSEVQSEAGG
jgi:hypothetical protein